MNAYHAAIQFLLIKGEKDTAELDANTDANHTCIQILHIQATALHMCALEIVKCGIDIFSLYFSVY